MGMISFLLRVPQDELEGYLADSSTLEDFIQSEETDFQDPIWCDLDKAWDAMLFVLTGNGIAESYHPLTKVLFSGQLVDEEQDLGYGPAHYLMPEQVVELNEELAKISIDEIRKRYSPEEMNAQDIYPGYWDQSEVAIDFVTDSFLALQKFYAEAAKDNHAVITFLT